MTESIDDIIVVDGRQYRIVVDGLDQVRIIAARTISMSKCFPQCRAWCRKHKSTWIVDVNADDFRLDRSESDELRAIFTDVIQIWTLSAKSIETFARFELGELRAERARILDEVERLGQERECVDQKHKKRLVRLAEVSVREAELVPQANEHVIIVAVSSKDETEE